jgi:hypothetical protein
LVNIISIILKSTNLIKNMAWKKWNIGILEEWKNGRMEEWKDGRRKNNYDLG